MRGFLENKFLFKAVYPDNLEDMVAGGSVDSILGKSMWMLVSVAIGLLCAVVGYVFHKGFELTHWLLTKHIYEYIPKFVVFPIFGGITAAVGGLVYHLTGLRGVWGIGIKALGEVLVQNPDIEAMDLLIFAIGKLFAFMIGVAVRFPGDTLEPVLIAGGFIGGVFGKLMPSDMMGQDANAACEIFGMVGLFASCFRFPLTPIIIVLELTGTRTYNIILPVALSSFTALAVSNHLFPPILEQILHQDGIDLEKVAELAEFCDDEELSFRDFEGSEVENDVLSHQSHQSHHSQEGTESQQTYQITRRQPSANSDGLVKPTVQSFISKLEESMFDVSSHDRTNHTRRASEYAGRGVLTRQNSSSGLYGGRGMRRFSMNLPSGLRLDDIDTLRRNSQVSETSSRRHGEHKQKRHSRRTSERGRRPSGRRPSARRHSRGPEPLERSPRVTCNQEVEDEAPFSV